LSAAGGDWAALAGTINKTDDGGRAYRYTADDGGVAVCSCLREDKLGRKIK
jgi:hypothetical protein